MANSKKTSGLPTSPSKFQSDYKYIPDSELRKLTATQLAKLEADLHNVRMMYVANGENPDIPMGSGRTIKQEMDHILGVISTLEEYFDDIINHEG